MKPATLAPSSVPPLPAADKASLRVVAMGGGTGLSTLLRGFKRYVPSPGNTQPECDDRPCLISHLSAIVTVTDDGGSSGRLRKDFNMLPPGDLRNCMVALSEDEHLIARLFRHRFRSGAGLEGHSFGTLFVAALSEMTGDFAQAIRLAAEILATRWHIYPVTTADVSLAARMDDGEIVRGETNITASKKHIVELSMVPPDAAPMPETLEAIELADVITVGPGSLYTSIITNLLVKEIPKALSRARGLRVFVCNLMTQANESLHLTASEHIERIYEHARCPIFDYALVNTAHVSEVMQARYAAEGAELIQPDVDRIEALGIRCISGNFADEGDVLRHAADRVAAQVLSLALEERARKEAQK